jgi:two-component system phosphate regulon sensor histidine kinase PhoR
VKSIRALISTIVTAVAILVAITAAAIDYSQFSSELTMPWMRALALGITSAVVLAGLGLPMAARIEKFLADHDASGTASKSIEANPGGLIGFLLQPLMSAVAIERRMRKAETEELLGTARNLEVQLRVAESEREHLEEILDSLRDAVFVTDRFGELLMSNNAAARLFEFVTGDVVGQPVDEILTDSTLLGLLEEVRSSGNPTSRRCVEHVMTRCGQENTYELSISCVTDEQLNIEGIVVILHDITREREISEMKSDFVSKASHELKTPLSSIKAYVEMLIDGEAQDDAARQEFYHIIQHESNRLAGLIDSMLNISRIEAGIIEVEWNEVDVGDLADSVTEVMLPQAQAKDISIAVKRAPQPLTAEADRNLIHQVLTNLISNAIKYTPEGGRITVSAALADCDRSVLVAVSDTGLGISPDDVPRLFDKFYRIDNYKRVAKGTGLGLNLVKQIVETVHRGEIGVESRLGLGSKFWFSVPCRRHASNRAA